MIKMLELRELIRLMDQTSIDELNLKNGGVRLLLKKHSREILGTIAPGSGHQENVEVGLKEAAVTVEVKQEATDAVPSQVESSQRSIVSPAVGVFSSTASPGDKITAGTIVGNCRVDALKIAQEIKSDISGEIVQAFVKDGEVVEYGQNLFLVKPE